MYTCPLHNWTSFYEPCPACRVPISGTTDNVKIQIPESHSLSVPGEQEKEWEEVAGLIDKHMNDGTLLKILTDKFIITRKP